MFDILTFKSNLNSNVCIFFGEKGQSFPVSFSLMGAKWHRPLLSLSFEFQCRTKETLYDTG